MTINIKKNFKMPVKHAILLSTATLHFFATSLRINQWCNKENDQQIKPWNSRHKYQDYIQLSWSPFLMNAQAACAHTEYIQQKCDCALLCKYVCMKGGLMFWITMTQPLFIKWTWNMNMLDLIVINYLVGFCPRFFIFAISTWNEF